MLVRFRLCKFQVSKYTGFFHDGLSMVVPARFERATKSSMRIASQHKLVNLIQQICMTRLAFSVLRTLSGAR